jgi:hypothetical protein
MPIVHPCARPECGTLTMGELCLEHELGASTLRPGRAQRPFAPRLVTASVLVVAAAAGALVGARLPR